MKKLQVKLNSEVAAPFKLIVTVLLLALTVLPTFIYIVTFDTFHLNGHLLLSISTLGATLFSIEMISLFLYSRFSPIDALQLRKKLILFTEQLTKQTKDGQLMHSVKWRYLFGDGNIIIELYARGLVADTERLGIQLSQYLNENLLSYKELNHCVRYTFGEFPKRLDGMEILKNDKL
ncbi:hypothetical protein E1309_07820 [Listeria monocytogenes]|nr:hypothetical protein [Listeria monocytogenes]EAD6210588.1 hypothetical protein [Listeria monocytogenes]EAE5616104.1 hypothetical protein [Listeria monocytogenes]